MLDHRHSPPEPDAMPNRYRRITGAEFSRGLDLASLTLGQFCRLYGAQKRRAERWLRDEEDIPHSVAVLLGLVEDQKVQQKARAITDHLIIEEDSE